MGFGKKRKKVRDAIEKWDCSGYFGYGQGRAVAVFGESAMNGKSACLDICTRANVCRLAHHEKMNRRFPQLAQLVESTARIARMRDLDVVSEVVSAMEHAVEAELEEAVEIRDRLSAFRIEQMTDHYRCGQFENIQNGLDKVSPKNERPRPTAASKAS